jgi:uncharacterized membrane protein YjjP (DUF1212 family)
MFSKLKTSLFATLLISVLCGCSTTKPTAVYSGKTSGDILEVAKTHSKNTDTIIGTAKEIYRAPTDEENSSRAETIIDASITLKQAEQTLIDAAAAKDTYESTIAKLVEQNTKLAKELESGNAKKYIWLRLIGAMMIAIGIGSMVYLKDVEMLAISVAGVALAASTFLFNMIENFINYIGIGLIILVGVFVYRAIVLPKRAASRAVMVGEALKQHLKEIGDTEFVEKIFGKGMIPGVISHDKESERIITDIRKELQKKAKPIVGSDTSSTVGDYPK